MGHLYFDADYVASLAGQGEPLSIPDWGGFLLKRAIVTGGYDAAGPYPLTPLTTQADITAGLEACRAAGLVSVVCVPDPLQLSGDHIRSAFPFHRPFKTHYLVTPQGGPFSPTKHHRDRIRRGHSRCRIERVRLADYLAEWNLLYAELVERRGITGPAAFPGEYTRMLARTPAVQAFAAFVGDELAAMTLWFAHDGIAYNHLTAIAPLGYASGASFALYDAAINHFAGQAINLGGGAGLDNSGDGLAHFKAGFANGEVVAHICGAVLDEARYAALGGNDAAFFPAYRAPA